jgi:adenosyl cobinamide kinase/adenosyl cobinamide phosphate guanylyltransferase
LPDPEVWPLHAGGLPIEGQTFEFEEVPSELGASVTLLGDAMGAGAVPATSLGRLFRDLPGQLNLAVAAACDAFFFVAAGLPIQRKPAPRPNVRLR